MLSGPHTFFSFVLRQDTFFSFSHGSVTDRNDLYIEYYRLFVVPDIHRAAEPGSQSLGHRVNTCGRGASTGRRFLSQEAMRVSFFAVRSEERAARIEPRSYTEHVYGRPPSAWECWACVPDAPIMWGLLLHRSERKERLPLPKLSAYRKEVILILILAFSLSASRFRGASSTAGLLQCMLPPQPPPLSLALKGRYFFFSQAPDIPERRRSCDDEGCRHGFSRICDPRCGSWIVVFFA